MATLTRNQKKRRCRRWTRAEKPQDLTSTDIEAAVQYYETWIADNKADAVSGLPNPFKAATNAAQKLALFVDVLTHHGGS